MVNIANLIAEAECVEHHDCELIVNSDLALRQVLAKMEEVAARVPARGLATAVEAEAAGGEGAK